MIEYIIPLLILFIIMLLFVILIQRNKIKEQNISYKTLDDDYKGWKDEFEFTKNELRRCREQISIYEKEEADINIIEINGKTIKKNNLYKGKRVLVGDYSKESSQNTMRVLKTFGIIVDVVRSGEDIIDRIKNGYKYDIIFTNNVYKNYSGSKVLNELKEIKEFKTPVIIHTVTQDARNEFVYEGGFDEYIAKPLSQEKIKPILKKFLSNNTTKKKKR